MLRNQNPAVFHSLQKIIIKLFWRSISGFLLIYKNPFQFLLKTYFFYNFQIKKFRIIFNSIFF
ncbi:MAG TPA: hypothetical protein DCY06_14555 [Bacteroidetes bacterium]|nr:hypothetical protein [Bacteroidota bacterium]